MYSVAKKNKHKKQEKQKKNRMKMTSVQNKLKSQLRNSLLLETNILKRMDKLKQTTYLNKYNVVMDPQY